MKHGQNTMHDVRNVVNCRGAILKLYSHVILMSNRPLLQVNTLYLHSQKCATLNYVILRSLMP